jgi:preprotein translocase subunit SecA
MLKKFVRIFGGDPNQRELENFSGIIDEVNDLEAEYETLSDDELRHKTDEFRQRFTEEVEGIEDKGELRRVEEAVLLDLVPEAFAAVREASKRTIGLRHYDVQLIGGLALHQGKIAEMRTGEGKTLVATLPLYLNALTGRGVHLVTVNDYLARRDARWMAPIYNALGLSVGVLQMAARTENGKKAFIVDLERTSPHEDQDQLRMVPRQEAYLADITYGTNSEFGFDYLRDNMVYRLDEKVQRGHFYAIVDEVDNVLIDEARTPLIISGPAQDESEWYIRMSQVVRSLRPEDYEISEKDRTVTLTEIGEAHVEELLGVALRDPERPEDVTPEQARLLGYLEQALRAQFLFRRNKDYLVQAGKVVIIDEFTGRLMPGRRWSDGLHQAVEAKEGVKVQAENVTYATITIQNYFRMYTKLAGMTGTALTEAEEFDKIYKLGVLAIPTNLEYQAMRPDSPLVMLDGRDELGYKYQYYAHRNDPEKKPVFWKRKDYPDVVYRTEEQKLRAITQEILTYHAMGRPMLVGTTSVELSERVSVRLRAEPLRRLAQVLLLRQAWFEAHNREEDGRQVPELQFLYAPLDQLDISAMRKLGRELSLSVNAEEPANVDRLVKILGLSPEDRPRLLSILQAGIPHQVLNARKHAEESQIIAGAGAFGAVTIATNMAGRGVDIKLGGDLAEEVQSAVNRVLRRAGYQDPYDMSLQDRRKALQALKPEDYGIYGSEVSYFLQYLDDMERVKRLGGLHVIGSERHEARRIDNQLRGRAARQGDPGSSRFYLSMEDELMRLFGGQQADRLMQRLKIDDALPLEVGLVGRIVEQSQTRVEGANFDVRKHLLEYDDVLNTQRTKIYAQRDLIFTKEDLSEDVTEMLRTEVIQRVPAALKEDEGPWRLLAWLDQVQPPLQLGESIFPSYTIRLLADHIVGGPDGTVSTRAAVEALLQIASESLKAEKEHLLNTVETLLDQTESHLEAQIKERLETVDTFFEGLSLEEDGEEPRDARQVLEDLNNAARFPLRLTSEQQRLLKNDPEALRDEVHKQVQAFVTTQAVVRLVGSVERRLEESLTFADNRLDASDWQALSRQILGAIEAVFDRRAERLLGESGNGRASGGQIARDLESMLARVNGTLSYSQVTQLLLLMPQGTRSTFDKKTHRRQMQQTVRLTYHYYAGHLLSNREDADIAEDVLDHLERAQQTIRQAWGQAEWSRVANIPPAEMDAVTQAGLRNALGDARYEQIANQPLLSLPEAERQTVMDELGRRTLTEIYRQLLLSVITELWVDYLTQMESLRVSIGLEAYAQRDPLVEYKSQAFALFQQLLSNMRLGVITRMFTYRPRDLSSVQATSREEVPQPQEEESVESAAEGPGAVEEAREAQAPAAVASSGGGKRRRRRHR